MHMDCGEGLVAESPKGVEKLGCAGWQIHNGVVKIDTVVLQTVHKGPSVRVVTTQTPTLVLLPVEDQIPVTGWIQIIGVHRYPWLLLFVFLLSLSLSLWCGQRNGKRTHSCHNVCHHEFLWGITTTAVVLVAQNQLDESLVFAGKA